MPEHFPHHPGRRGLIRSSAEHLTVVIAPDHRQSEEPSELPAPYQGSHSDVDGFPSVTVYASQAVCSNSLTCLPQASNCAWEAVRQHIATTAPAPYAAVRVAPQAAGHLAPLHRTWRACGAGFQKAHFHCPPSWYKGTPSGQPHGWRSRCSPPWPHRGEPLVWSVNSNIIHNLPKGTLQTPYRNLPAHQSGRPTSIPEKGTPPLGSSRAAAGFEATLHLW